MFHVRTAADGPNHHVDLMRSVMLQLESFPILSPAMNPEWTEPLVPLCVRTMPSANMPPRPSAKPTTLTETAKSVVRVVRHTPSLVATRNSSRPQAIECNSGVPPVSPSRTMCLVRAALQIILLVVELGNIFDLPSLYFPWTAANPGGTVQFMGRCTDFLQLACGCLKS